MPPSEPKKETIAKAVVVLLKGIRAGATYRKTAVTVLRRRLIASELNTTTMPALSVWLGDSEENPKCMGSFGESVDILIEAWVKGDPAKIETELNEIEADVTTAMLTDSTIASTVLRVRRVSVKSDHQEFADRGQGWRPIRFVAEYNWTAAAP